MNTKQENGSPLEMTPAPEATAMVVSNTATIESYKKGLEPTSLMEAYKLAEVISKTGICGTTSAADVLVRLLHGRELGLTAMQAISGVYVVNSKPGVYAEVLEALCIQHPDCEKWEWIERSDTRAELLIGRRNRKEQTIVWTLDDAKRAQLLKEDSNWMKYPRRMLAARCRSEGAGLMFPDATRGMKAREELEDMPPEPMQVPNAGAQLATNAAAQEAAAKVLKEQIAAVKTREEKAAAREAMTDAEKKGLISGPYLDGVRAAYNEKFAAKPKAETALPTAAVPTAKSGEQVGLPPAADPSKG